MHPVFVFTVFVTVLFAFSLLLIHICRPDLVLPI